MRLLAIIRNELRFAWLHFRVRASQIYSGLGDAGWLLHGLVRAQKPEVCVEIGSAHGYSTCLIALALEQNIRGHLWAVDPHITNHWSDEHADDTYNSLQRHLRMIGQAGDRVTIVRKCTRAAVDDLPSRIDMAFIDGDHGYDGVKFDWETIQPRMSPFGVVVFHDTLWDRFADDPYYRKWRRAGMGVPRLLEEIRLAGYPVITLDRDWGVTLVQAIPGGQSFAYPGGASPDQLEPT